MVYFYTAINGDFYTAIDTVPSHASPLYGRRSRDMLLEGLPFSASRKFINMSFQEALETYMILGGVPGYPLKASEYTDILDFVEKEFSS